MNDTYNKLKSIGNKEQKHYVLNEKIKQLEQIALSLRQLTGIIEGSADIKTPDESPTKDDLKQVSLLSVLDTGSERIAKFIAIAKEQIKRIESLLF